MNLSVFLWLVQDVKVQVTAQQQREFGNEKLSHSVTDPCDWDVYIDLNDPWRKDIPANVLPGLDASFKSDYKMDGHWFRFGESTETKMQSRCAPLLHCGTRRPVWLNVSHPTLKTREVQHYACVPGLTRDDCCQETLPIKIRLCEDPEDGEHFYVYKLPATPFDAAYCTGKWNVGTCLGTLPEGQRGLFPALCEQRRELPVCLPPGIYPATWKQY
uniref:UMOD/GP2/OIT3-like D8C domain-containing protein n=1 Tax=Callorhinchus milii TaxID=7868 RepID=A0A4W3HQ26_CALMI